MRLARRQFLKLAISASAAPAFVRNAAAQAQHVLKLHHFLPPLANAHTRLLSPWARKVETESGGRIRIEIYPSMQLGGTPAQLFDQARDGKADIVWTLPGLTPERFPRIEVFELPFVANRKAIANARAVQDFYGLHLRDEFSEIHPICLWAHDGGVVHARKAIAAMDDLKGLKLRSPTRLAGEALTALGASGIVMPIPQVQEALSRQVIDGCVVPWEVVPAIRVHELVKFHTEIPGSPTLYTATFVLAMNKVRYLSLPDDLKAVIDANSGAAAAAAAGKMWDERAQFVEDMVKSRGNAVTLLDPAEAARWQRATAPVINGWLLRCKQKGIEGEKLLADARSLLTKYENA